MHNRIFNIKKITPFTDFAARSKFSNGFVMGKINYLLPIYSIATQENLSKIQKIIMSAARAAIGNYCFRKSTQYILIKCK